MWACLILTSPTPMLPISVSFIKLKNWNYFKLNRVPGIGVPFLVFYDSL